MTQFKDALRKAQGGNVAGPKTQPTDSPVPTNSPAPTDSLPLPASAPRLHFIDGLRGLAMLMVLLYHCWLFGGGWQVLLPLGAHRLNLASALSFGHVGVNLFLVLSGFCLYWPFTQTGRREPTLRQFAQKRCRRILPPYFVTLLLSTAIPLCTAVHSSAGTETMFLLRWLGWHLLMIHNLRPEYILTLNGSLWSLGLEFQLYILFPLLVEAYRRFPARRVLLAVLLGCTAFRSFLVHGQYTPTDEYGYVLAYSVFGRCFEFALGMFAARLVADWHRTKKSPVVWSDYLLIAVIVPLAIVDGRHGHFQALTDSMYGLLFAMLLVAGSRPERLLHTLLSNRLLVRLGIFSYSVYLIHLPLVMLLGGYAARHFSNPGQVLFSLLVIVPLMLGLGYLFHLMFERPFMTAPRVHPSPPAVILEHRPE